MAGLENHNQTYAVDGRLGIEQNGRIAGFASRTNTPGVRGYNDDAELWSANLRLGLLEQANTGLFVVYNDTRGLHDTIPAGSGRSLILKYSHMFDLID